MKGRITISRGGGGEMKSVWRGGEEGKGGAGGPGMREGTEVRVIRERARDVKEKMNC